MSDQQTDSTESVEPEAPEGPGSVNPDAGDSDSPMEPEAETSGQDEPRQSDGSGESGPVSAESGDPARKGLEALEQDIREVREKADDLIVGPDENSGERFYESGDSDKSGDDADDQTITPPG